MSAQGTHLEGAPENKHFLYDYDNGVFLWDVLRHALMMCHVTKQKTLRELSSAESRQATLSVQQSI